MFTVLKNISIYLIGSFLLIQLIRVDIPVSTTDPKLELQAPVEVVNIFKKACYDCHSNEVVLPWYSNVAPISWTISRHVDLGRKWLNFSIWESYTQEEKDKKLTEIYKSVYKAMPLDSYMSQYEEARITKKERNLIRAWTGKSPF